MNPNKACPVVARLRGHEIDVLAFRHPLAGLQLVKGTIEPSETPTCAAVRELAEESGLIATGATKELGEWCGGYQDQVWAFHLVRVAHPLPDTWDHFTSDGGGLLLRFFWHPLGMTPTAEWHPLFQGALQYLQAHLPVELLLRNDGHADG